MAESVVGWLRALLTMDTANFEAGAQKGIAASKKLDTALGNLAEQTGRLTTKAEQMVTELAGDKLLVKANNLTAAVNKIGGASKLTETEQARVNKTVSDAIAKYAALGQSAPKEMIALANATKRVESSTTTLASSFQQLNGVAALFGVSLGVGGLISFGNELLRLGDDLVRVADRTGLTTTEVQRLQFIAKQSGNSLDELTGAIGRLQNNLVSGDKSAVAAVKFLKINLDELKAASPFDQMGMLATAIQKIPDPATRSAVAIDLFGRTGAAILPTLISDFVKLGNAAPVMSDKTVRALDQAGDALNQFQMQLKVWAAESFNFAGRLFDQYVIHLRRAAALGSDALASLLGLAGKVPGVAAVFEHFGITVEKLHGDAQLLRDGANATEAQLNTLDKEVRKNVGGMVDYEGAVKKTTSALKNEKDAAREAAAALNALDQAAQAQLQFEQGRLKNEGDTFADEMKRKRFEQLQTDADAEEFFKLEQRRFEASGDAFADDMAFRKKTQEDYAKLQRDVANETGQAIQDADRKRMRERTTLWTGFSKVAGDTFNTLNAAIAGSFAQMALGAKHFKDAFIDIWQAIKAAVIRIFAEITGAFITGMLKKMSASLAGTAVAGAATGAAVGAGAAAATTGAVAAGAGGTAAAAGGLAGAGGAIAAFATNPITIGVAAGIGAFLIGRKLFSGGEEAKVVNPRRDLFTGQFGGPGALAAKLTAITGIAGGGGLFRQLQAADTAARFETAEKAIVGFLTTHGMRGAKLFNLGGFVPPGVIQPALLHGGAFGEDVTPRSGPSAGQTVNTVNLHISAIDAKGVRQFVESRDFTDSLDRAFFHNKGFLATRIRASLVP